MKDRKLEHFGFKFARQNMKFVNKHFTANQRQAALLSTTDISGK